LLINYNMLLFNNKKIKIQSLELKNQSKKNVVNILRLDEIDKVISGNKIFKLQVSIQKAIELKYSGIVTCGGAFSNHIVATAAICNALGLKSKGIIRGEEMPFNHTLQHATVNGMELFFVDRNTFKDKKKLQQQFEKDGYYWINEGGYSIDGAVGAAEICNYIDDNYTHIVCACGTGTMMAGIIKGANTHQQVIGISVLKGYQNLENDIAALLTETEKNKSFQVLHNYHFGGYAKHPQSLINYMNDCYQQHHLPTDIIYTSKLIFAVEDLLSQQYFGESAKIMVIHSGGLQGNLSLPKNTLVF